MKVYDDDGVLLFDLKNTKVTMRPLYSASLGDAYKGLYLVSIEGLNVEKEVTSSFEESGKPEGSWRDKPPML